MKKFLFFTICAFLAVIQPSIGENVTKNYKISTSLNSMGTFGPSSVEYLYYNGDNMKTIVMKYRVADLTKTSEYYTYEYDSHGNLIEDVNFMNDGDGFYPYERNIYTYSENESGVWLLNKREIYDYDQSSNTEEVKGWNIYSYDVATGNLISMEEFRKEWSTGNIEWFAEIKYLNYLAPGCPQNTEKYTIPYGETEKTVSEKSDYTYNSDNQILTVVILTQSYEDPSVYKDNSKTIYEYVDGKVSVVSRYEVDWEIGELDMDMPASETTYTYDANGLLIDKSTKEKTYVEDNSEEGYHYELLLASQYVYDNAANYNSDNAPLNFEAEFAGAGVIDLSWSAPLNNTGLTGYKIIMSGAIIATIEPNATSYKIQNVKIGEYDFAVQALYDEIGSNISDLKFVTVIDPKCAAPTDLRLANDLVFDETSRNYPVNLTWTAPVTEYTVLGYNIYRDGSLQNFSELLTETNYSQQLNITNTYVYDVVAVYAEGNSPKSESLDVNIVNKYEVTLNVNIAKGVKEFKGTGFHFDGSEVTIDVVLNKEDDKYIYEFVNWQEKLDMNQGYKVVSTDPEYKFTITRDMVFVATLSRSLVGVDENDNLNTKIYSSNGKISIESSESAGALVEVISLDGKIIKSFIMSSDVEVVNVQKSGLYVVRMTNGDSVNTKKVIVD